MQPSVTDYHALGDQALPSQFSQWNDHNNDTANLDASKEFPYVHETRDNHSSQDRVSDEQLIDIDVDGNDHAGVHITHEPLKSVATPTTSETASPGYPESDEGTEQQYVIPAHLDQRGPPASMIFTSADEDVSVPQQSACESIPDTSDLDADGAATPTSTDELKASPDSSDVSITSSEDVSSLVSKLSSLREQNKINEVLEALQKSGLLEALENKKEQKPTTGEKVPESIPRHDVQNKCPKCDKGFPRPCELKYVSRRE